MNSTSQILQKLQIERLNEMQSEAILAIENAKDTVLLSPTGSGKTLAFLLPIIQSLDIEARSVQALVIAPTRELSMQIESVARSMATGFKVNVVYGGRPIKKDLAELATLPDLLIGTPGRIGDHLRRGTIDGAQIRILVIDEYDKSLEMGFDEEMSEIYSFLPHLTKRILTSATAAQSIPAWLSHYKPIIVDHLDQQLQRLTLKRIASESKDKLYRLYTTLQYLSGQRGIVFLNFKDSIERTSDFLQGKGIAHGIFHGGLDQHERERSLIQFRNGSYDILLATDLAARGIDVPDLDFILHYHLPLKAEEFTHRNGRTARMHSRGVAYILHWTKEELPDFIPSCEEEEIPETTSEITDAQWTTILVSGGRKDKISKGDIAGFCIKIGGLLSHQVGMITIQTDCTFVAIDASVVDTAVQNLNDQKIKKRKVRVYKI